MSGDTDPDGPGNSSSQFMQLMGFVKKKPQLPEGWIVTQSSTYPDRVYFFNTRTAASTWEPPIAETSDALPNPCVSATSTDARALPGQTSKKTTTKSSKTKGTSTTTAQNPSSATLSKSKQQLGKAHPSRGPIPSSGGYHQKDAGKTLEGRQRITGWTEEAVSKQDKVVRLQRLKDARSEYISKKRNLDDKLGFFSRSPPWGVPVRTSNLGGTLTPESLTPKSLPSRGGPSDISSVSSQSSKFESPTATKLPTTGRKRGHQDSSSSGGHARTKSKQLKATQNPKSQVDAQENDPARRASRRAGKEDTRASSVIQSQASAKAAQNDLRLKLAMTRQLKVPEKPSPSASQTATSTASSTMTSPHQPPSSEQSDKPNDKAAEQSAFLTKMKKRRTRHKKKALKQVQETTASLTSRPPEKKGFTIPTTTKKDHAAQEENTRLSNQGVVSFPDVQEEDDSTQMEIDINTDSVDCNNVSNSQDLGVRIVLDTNALMHHLQFVRELLDKLINGLGRPILVIPWVVMQELDGLKSGTGKDGIAWKAIWFLHKCFMSKHPRVQGEPLRKVSDEADFEITCNDDWILQCCLQHQKKVGPDLVILLSNDKHLCSKAVISGIKAYSTETLLSSLEDLASILQHRPPVPPTLSTRAGSTSNDQSTAALTHRPRTPEMSLTAHSERELCDELVSEVKEVLRPALSIVVETEMKKAYDDLWMEIVIVQPPWTFEDLMKCFEKHWMAVFGCFLNKEDNRRFLQIMELTSDTQTSLSVVKTLVTNCIFFCRRLRQHSAYDKAPEQAILKLGELKRRCQANPPEADQRLSNEELARLESGKVVDTTVIPSVFEAIWSKIIQLRALIFEGLGVQHDLDTDRTIVIPSELECQACLNILCPLLQQLIEALERVTEIPDSLVLEKPLPFERLCEVIHTFLHEFITRDQQKFSSLSPLAFQRFIIVYSNRQLLRNGIIQLTDASIKLAQCQSMLSS